MAPSYTTAIYTFSSSNLRVNGTDYGPTSTSIFAGGWSRTVPANDTRQCWVTHATAASTEASDSISTSEWSTPAEIGSPGTPGAQGDAGIAYRVTAFMPNTEYWAGDGTPRIIDVVVNKDVGFINDDDFGAWECISHHVSTSSSELPAVGQSNSQWKAYDKYNPMVTPLLISTQIEAKYIATKDLTAEKVLTSDNSGLNVLIESGKVNIYNGDTTNNLNLRAAFGLDSSGDVILSFYKNVNGTLTKMYDLGPSGWNKRY